jgi:citrate synthase
MDLFRSHSMHYEIKKIFHRDVAQKHSLEHNMEEFAEIKLPTGEVHKIQLLTDVYGTKLLNIQNLYESTSLLTYDPGFTSTAACRSAITYIDGNRGKCLYRGYAVSDLCVHCSYTEVAFLLLYGELPTENQLAQFESNLKEQAMVHEKFKAFFNGFTSGAHPMAITVSVIGALSAFYHHELAGWWTDPLQRDMTAIRIIGKFPTIAAMAFKTAIGQPVMYPKKNLSYAANFLYMMFATPMEEYIVDPVAERALNAFFVLHADHEQNASTATVRIAGSSQANPFACIAAGVASLWGPAHGGANEAVMNMLREIGTVDKIPEFIADVKAKKVRLMGFGHRIYKNYDGRAVAMRQLTMDVLHSFGKGEEELFRLAVELERIALADEYFVSRRLYPNVDFYSGIMLTALGIPTSMFTVLFALARSVGWITHWREMISESQLKIGRPRQMYFGEKEREWEPLENRVKSRTDSMFKRVNTQMLIDRETSSH